MLDDKRKEEVNHFISTELGINFNEVTHSKDLYEDFEAKTVDLMSMQQCMEDYFEVEMGDCKHIDTVGDLYGHIDTLLQAKADGNKEN